MTEAVLLLVPPPHPSSNVLRQYASILPDPRGTNVSKIKLAHLCKFSRCFESESSSSGLPLELN